MKSDYHRASADMSYRTLAEIRRGDGPRPKARGKCLSCLYLERPQPLSARLSPQELDEAKQQAARYSANRYR